MNDQTKKETKKMIKQINFEHPTDTQRLMKSIIPLFAAVYYE